MGNNVGESHFYSCQMNQMLIGGYEIRLLETWGRREGERDGSIEWGFFENKRSMGSKAGNKNEIEGSKSKENGKWGIFC